MWDYTWRTTGNFRAVLLASAALIMGSVAFVLFVVTSVQDSFLIRNSVTVTGMVYDKSYSVTTTGTGSERDTYTITYVYSTGDSDRMGEQDVASAYYVTLSEGQAITVYYDRNNPSTSFIDLDGKVNSKRWGLILSPIFALVGGIMLYFMFRNSSSSKPVVIDTVNKPQRM